MPHHKKKHRWISTFLKLLVVLCTIGVCVWAVVLVGGAKQGKVLFVRSVADDVPGAQAVGPAVQPAISRPWPILPMGLAAVYFVFVVFFPDSRIAGPVASVMARSGTGGIRLVSIALAALGLAGMILYPAYVEGRETGLSPAGGQPSGTAATAAQTGDHQASPADAVPLSGKPGAEDEANRWLKGTWRSAESSNYYLFTGTELVKLTEAGRILTRKEYTVIRVEGLKIRFRFGDGSTALAGRMAGDEILWDNQTLVKESGETEIPPGRIQRSRMKASGVAVSQAGTLASPQQ